MRSTIRLLCLVSLNCIIACDESTPVKTTHGYRSVQGALNAASTLPSELVISEANVKGEVDDFEVVFDLPPLDTGHEVRRQCSGEDVIIEVYAAESHALIETLSYACVLGTSLDRLALPRGFDNLDKVVVIKFQSTHGMEELRRVRIPAGQSKRLRARSPVPIPRSTVAEELDSQRGMK